MIRSKINISNKKIEDMVFIKITNEDDNRPFGIPAIVNENSENIIIFDISDHNLFNQQMEESDYDRDVFFKSFLQYPTSYMSAKSHLYEYKNCFIQVDINDKRIKYFRDYSKDRVKSNNKCNERLIQVPLKIVEELNNQIFDIFNFDNDSRGTFNFTKDFYFDGTIPKLFNITEDKFYNLKNLIVRKIPTFNYFRHTKYISIAPFFSFYFLLFHGVLYRDSSYLKYILKNISVESKELLNEIKDGMLPIFDVMDCQTILLYPALTDYAKLKINKACEELGL